MEVAAPMRRYLFKVSLTSKHVHIPQVLKFKMELPTSCKHRRCMFSDGEVPMLSNILRSWQWMTARYSLGCMNGRLFDPRKYRYPWQRPLKSWVGEDHWSKEMTWADLGLGAMETDIRPALAERQSEKPDLIYTWQGREHQRPEQTRSLYTRYNTHTWSGWRILNWELVGFESWEKGR